MKKKQKNREILALWVFHKEVSSPARKTLSSTVVTSLNLKLAIHGEFFFSFPERCEGISLAVTLFCLSPERFSSSSSHSCDSVTHQLGHPIGCPSPSYPSFPADPFYRGLLENKKSEGVTATNNSNIGWFLRVRPIFEWFMVSLNSNNLRWVVRDSTALDLTLLIWYSIGRKVHVGSTTLLH